MDRTTPTVPSRHGAPRATWLVLSVVSVLALTACSRGDHTSALAWQTLTNTIGDTIVVRTVGASDSAAELRLVEELRIGVFEGDDEYGFANVGTLLPAADGGVYVWDETLGVLRQYAADGRFVRQIGRKGGGPGEYQGSNGLTRLPDGRLALWDAANTRVTLYDSAGAHVAQWRATSNLFGSNGLESDTAGRLYLFAFVDSVNPAQLDAPRRQGYVRFGADGRVLDSIAAPPTPEYQAVRVTRREGDRVMNSMFTLPYAPQPVSVLTPFGYYASGEGSRYAVTLHRTDAPPLRIERDVAVVPIDPDDRQNQTEMLTASVRRMDPGWRWNGPPIPETKPAFRSLDVGADGRIWVMRSMPGVRIEPAPEPPANPNAPPARRWREPLAYDVFEPDGRLVGHLPMPRRTSLRHMNGERVWGVVTDSLDVPYVTRFRLEAVASGAPPR